MKKSIHVCFLFVLLCTVYGKVAAQQRDIDTLSERLRRQYVSERVDVKEINTQLRADGSWPDIDYNDTLQSDFRRHATRLRQLAIAYCSPSNPLYHSAALLNNLKMAFTFFYPKKWKTTNWWYGDIGMPVDYMAALLLLKGVLPKDESLRYASFLKDATGNTAHQGMNRVWVSRITINKGCIEDNYALIEKGFRSAASTLVIAESPGTEGIKPDWSFHQHRAQLYSGGYGASFIIDMTDLKWLSNGTSFAALFTPAERAVFSSLLLQGHQLLQYRGVADFGTVGRGIARPGGLSGMNAGTLDKLQSTDSMYATAFNQWSAHLHGGVYPAAFRGNKYFWCSAIMTQHGPESYLSAKVISTRTAGTEMLNDENLQGYNLPLGATNILVTGKEYHDIFPVWEWSRVPGVTAVSNNAASRLSWYLFGSNDFAGGVSDGNNGVLAYEHNYNGVRAKKAYFFIDNYLLCMGAGITAMKTQGITTSLDQNLLNGPVSYGYAGSPAHELHQETSLTVDTTAALWVYHNRTGYLLPQGGKAVVQLRTQTGSWKAINGTAKADVIRQNVFSLWLRHGEQPTNQSYVYQVVPAVSRQVLEKMALSPGYNIIQNTDTLQAVITGVLRAAVFYQSGMVDWGDGWQLRIDRPAVVLMKIEQNHCYITIADPLHRQKTINVSIQKNTEVRTIKIDLPEGAMQGSHATAECTF